MGVVFNTVKSRAGETGGDNQMELLIFLFKSGLTREYILETSEKRAEQYLKVDGLIQKYYVEDLQGGRVGGIFIFDTEQNLNTFRDSELAKSTGEAYKFKEPPQAQVLGIAKVLHESWC